MRFSGPELVLPRTLGDPLDAFTTPVRPGDDMQTYLIRATSKRSPEEMAHVLLVPTNEADADFEIETIWLIFRGEHLRSIASGVGWHGMSEIYNEAIVTRAPERVRYQVDLPAEPFLDLGVATIETGPVTFRVEVGDRVLETVVDEPDAWHAASLDLEGMGGERVGVTLSIDAADPGTLGFWGAPAIRSNAAPENQPQAVILIITDTLRADHLDLYGYGRQTAPTLARIAGEGVWFEDTISQATWTKVSVTTIQTSLYPTTHTVEDIPDRLPASAATIAEAYRSAGYATLALTSIPFVGQLTNLHQGYEVMHESGSLPDWENLKSSPELVPRLLPWMESHRDTPFFALLHVADPHSPFRPTEDYETTYAEPGDMDELDALDGAGAAAYTGPAHEGIRYADDIRARGGQGGSRSLRAPRDERHGRLDTGHGRRPRQSLREAGRARAQRARARRRRGRSRNGAPGARRALSRPQRHRDDPLDQSDVAGEHPEIVERLTEMLDNWRGFAEAARLDDEAATGQIAAAELERLRALGYVQ